MQSFVCRKAEISNASLSPKTKSYIVCVDRNDSLCACVCLFQYPCHFVFYQERRAEKKATKMAFHSQQLRQERTILNRQITSPVAQPPNFNIFKKIHDLPSGNLHLRRHCYNTCSACALFLSTHLKFYQSLHASLVQNGVLGLSSSHFCIAGKLHTEEQSFSNDGNGLHTSGNFVFRASIRVHTAKSA